VINGYEYLKGPWHDVEALIASTRTLYDTQITPKGGGDIPTIVRAKSMEKRKWGPSKPLIESRFDEIVHELGIFYIPKQVDPGPGIVFPQRDIYGRFTYGKYYPFEPIEFPSSTPKYIFLGHKDPLSRPQWFGNTDQVLTRIGVTRFVVIVEGFFDLLACRLLVPDLPVLSTGTKTINDDHMAYLQMLGVERVYLLFDNETSSRDDEGAGNKAMRIISSVYGKKTGVDFRTLLCPNDDPSMCLESYRAAKLLRDQLQEILDKSR
jgi:hypothetical protein